MNEGAGLYVDLPCGCAQYSHWGKAKKPNRTSPWCVFLGFGMICNLTPRRPTGAQIHVNLVPSPASCTMNLPRAANIDPKLEHDSAVQAFLKLFGIGVRGS